MRPFIQSVADAMERKLQASVAKYGDAPKNLSSVHNLKTHLIVEVGELLEAVDRAVTLRTVNPDSPLFEMAVQNIQNEVGDVANLAGLLAEAVGACPSWTETDVDDTPLWECSDCHKEFRASEPIRVSSHRLDPDGNHTVTDKRVICGDCKVKNYGE